MAKRRLVSVAEVMAYLRANGFNRARWPAEVASRKARVRAVSS